MLRNCAPWFLAAIVALANPAHAAITPDAPHSAASGITCVACHSTHPVLGGTGYNNICLNCHRPGFPRGGGKPFTEADMANPFGTFTAIRNGVIFQTSHAWQGSDSIARAGALPPVQALLTTNSLRTRTNGRLACVRCHNQHSNQYGSFLRAPNDQDQLCLDCHRPRNTTTHTSGSHPVGVDYAAVSTGNPAFKGFSARSGLKLIGGKVLCSSCHGVHYSDSRSGTQKGAASYLNLSTGDGNILRTALRGRPTNAPNLCTTCHAGKVSHNKRSQDVQCGDCHGGHVDSGDGTTPNVWLVNRQMRFSSALRSAKNQPVLFQSTVVKNYKDANGNGVCQSCHDIPLSAGFQTYHGAADTTGCNSCHAHANPIGSFSVDPSKACSACHGYPPRANTAGGPDGYAAGSPFTAEATSGHATHAFTPYQKACTECHTNNAHATGTFQDVFIPPTTGLVAATGGLTPTYTAATFTCANVYCHSDGAPRTGVTVNLPAPKVIPSWSGGLGVITGQPNAVRCNSCHNQGATLSTNSHPRHLNSAGYSYACALCHSATVSGSSFALTSIIDVTRHTNGQKDVVFGGIAAGGSWTAGTAACSNLYCHSNVQGAGGAGGPTSFATPHWGLDNGTVGCGSCHLNMATATAPTGSHKTHAQAPYTLYACSLCHGAGYISTTVTPATHANDSIELAFTGTAITGGVAPTYYGGNTKAPGSGYQQCQNVYCHSTVQNSSNGTSTGVIYKTPVWGNAASVGTCGGCHVNMATDTAGTGNHAKHARIYAMACSTCHSGAGKDPNTGVASALHADGTIEIAFSGAIATGTTYTQGNNAPGGGYGNCANSYCHSNGNGTFQTPTWGTTLDCGGCHNKAGDVTWSAPHLKHVTTYAANSNLTCNACHANTASSNTAISTPANHANGVKNVSFNAFAGGSYSGGICNNVYCHSNGQISTPAYATVTWAATTLSCGDCHGTSNSGTLSSKHTPHTNNAAVIGTNFTCSDCHAKTVAAGNGTITDYSKHVNKFVDYSGIKAGGSTSYNSTTKVCTNIYCHSSGKRGIVAASTEPANPAWNTGTLDCKGCHGARSTPAAGVAFNSIAGEPNYTNAGRGQPGANSHQKHVSPSPPYIPISCISCHYNTVNAAGNAITIIPAGQKHIDRTIDVIWDLSNPSTTQFDYTPSTKTCSNIVCHGTLTPRSSSPAQWGDSGCRVCHTAAVPDPVFMNTNWGTLKGTKPGKIVYTTWSTTGHGRPASAGNYPGSGNPPAKLVGPRGCEYCHDPAVGHNSASGSNPMQLRNITDPAWGLNGVCQACHAKGGTTVTIGDLPPVAVQTRISSYHKGGFHSVANGGQWCWDCHNPHGDSINIFMINGQVAQNSNAGGDPSTLRFATFTAARTGGNYVADNQGICRTCHTAVPFYTQGGGSGHNITTRCTICHSHNGPSKSTAFQ